MSHIGIHCRIRRHRVEVARHAAGAPNVEAGELLLAGQHLAASNSATLEVDAKTGELRRRHVGNAVFGEGVQKIENPTVGAEDRVDHQIAVLFVGVTVVEDHRGRLLDDQRLAATVAS